MCTHLFFIFSSLFVYPVSFSLYTHLFFIFSSLFLYPVSFSLYTHLFFIFSSLFLYPVSVSLCSHHLFQPSIIFPPLLISNNLGPPLFPSGPGLFFGAASRPLTDDTTDSAASPTALNWVPLLGPLLIILETNIFIMFF